MVITNGSYVAIRTINGDIWWGAPVENLPGPATGEKPEGAQPFVIVKVDGGGQVLQGEIKSGDTVKIRGTRGDPYLAVIDGAVRAGDFKNLPESILLIDKCSGEGAIFQTGDAFHIRSAQTEESWFVSNDIGPLTTNSKKARTPFVFVDASIPGDIARDNALHQLPPTFDGNKELCLGYMNIWPCSRFEPRDWVDATWKWADQRVSVILTISDDLALHALDETKACAATALVAATLTSLLTQGSGAVATFQATFAACISQKVTNNVNKSISIDVRTQCMW